MSETYQLGHIDNNKNSTDLFFDNGVLKVKVKIHGAEREDNFDGSGLFELSSRMHQYFFNEKQPDNKSKGIDIIRELAKNVTRNDYALAGSGHFRAKNGTVVSHYTILQELEHIRTKLNEAVFELTKRT